MFFAHFLAGMAGISRLTELRRRHRDEEVPVVAMAGTSARTIEGSTSSHPPRSHRPTGVSPPKLRDVVV